MTKITRKTKTTTKLKAGDPVADNGDGTVGRAKAAVKAKQAAAADQFAEADAKGAPTAVELEAIQVGQQVRGY